MGGRWDGAVRVCVSEAACGVRKLPCGGDGRLHVTVLDDRCRGLLRFLGSGARVERTGRRPDLRLGSLLSPMWCDHALSVLIALFGSIGVAAGFLEPDLGATFDTSVSRR